MDVSTRRMRILTNFPYLVNKEEPSVADNKLFDGPGYPSTTPSTSLSGLFKGSQASLLQVASPMLTGSYR